MLFGATPQAHSRRAMRRVVDLPCQVVSSRTETPIDYADLEPMAQGLLLVTMIVGRLEALALIALFNRDFWRS